MVNVFDPEVIVLTGGMIRAGERALLEPTRAFLADFAMPELLEGVELELSCLDDRAGIIGAAAVGFQGAGRQVLVPRESVRGAAV